MNILCKYFFTDSRSPTNRSEESEGTILSLHFRTWRVSSFCVIIVRVNLFVI
ncbi:MAG: hypothetical protein KKD86_16800 [Bacteroidetes bacterium]|nr:hypothetical protein [Bacteroidota bacterium]MBU1680485.1 hypothetical protein [Bacteroidota bacterium]